MKFILFTFTFLFIVNRGVLYAFIEGLLHRNSQKKKKDITDPKILDFIYQKTGLRLSKIFLFETDKVWGMMAGLPPKPYMIISTDASSKLNKDEMEWVYLHEAGHSVLWHNYKMVLLQIVLVLSGVFVLNIIFRLELLTVLLLSILLSILYFQIARFFEYEANDFALKRVTNPQGIITLKEKARQRWLSRKIPLKGFKQKLFHTWTFNIYEDLAMNAKKEVILRNKSRL